jgi:NAD+ kinase
MRVLIVYKRSFLEAHGDEARGLAQLGEADRARLVRSDAENRRALGDLTAHLARRGVPFDAVQKGALAARKKYSLVVALGGDGTFFAAARHVGETPLLGINSDPAHSLGLWTAADRTGFGPVLDRALDGRLREVPVHRIRLSINGRPVRELAFNDVLLAHRNPAAMTRYRITAGREEAEHKSSGVWVATAAGSTAALRSAGGRRMPVASKRLQFVVREPYGWPVARPRLLRGQASRIQFQALTVDLAAWIDGSRVRHDLALGDRVELQSGPPVRVLGYDDARRARLFP